MELVVQSGPDAGKIYQVEGPQMVAGRQAGTEIMLNDLQVSRRHASFELNNGVLLINDLGSANGTRLNGQLLAPNQPRPLNPGDRVELGDTVMVVRARQRGPGPFQAPAAASAGAYGSGPAAPGAYHAISPAPPAPGAGPAFSYPQYQGQGAVDSAAPAPARQRSSNGVLLGGLAAIILITGLAVAAILLLANRTDQTSNPGVFNPPSAPAGTTTPVRGPTPTVPTGSSGTNPPPPSPPAAGYSPGLAFAGEFIYEAGLLYWLL